MRRNREQQAEKLAALALGLLPEDEARAVRHLAQRDPDARARLDELHATLTALEAWRTSVSSTPAYRFTATKRESVFWPLAIAATLLLAVGLTTHMMLTHSETATLEGSLAWTTELTASPKEWTVRYTPAKLQQGGQEHVPAGKPADYPARVLDPHTNHSRFLAQNAPIRAIPEVVLSDLRLAAMQSDRPGRLHLVYTNRTRRVDVFLAASAGDDTRFRRLQLGSRQLVAARRNHVLAAFDGDLERDQWQSLLSSLLAERGRHEHNDT